MMYKSQYLKKIQAKDLPYKSKPESTGLDEPMKIVTQADPEKAEYVEGMYGMKHRTFPVSITAGGCYTGGSLSTSVADLYDRKMGHEYLSFTACAPRYK